MLSNSMQLSLSDVFSYLRKNPASNTSVTDPLLVPMDNVNSKIIKTLLPLMNFEYLSSFEEHVRREDFRDSVIRHLRLKGGESLGNAVRRILVCLLTDEFAQNFSWLGFKKKKVFTDTCLPDIIFDAIRCQESFKNASDTEIAKPLRSWLVHAKDRANSKKDSTQTTATRRSFNSKHK